MRRRDFILNSCFIGGVIPLLSCKSFAEPDVCTTLWQLDSQTPYQMNSYVLKTPNDKIIVIDGGYKQDAPYLKGFLAALGNKVNLWIVTHPHPDHINALTEILKKPDGLIIEEICGSFPSEDWVVKAIGKESEDLRNFNKALAASEVKYVDLKLGDILHVDKIKMEILGVKNPEITGENAINNSSLVLKMYFKTTTILFLADLGYEGGEKLLNSEYASQLPSGYVQMAHHGQQGVGEDFYKKVDPEYCLWPTPDWLWDNNIKNQGKGSGPWKTLEVRAWMEKLHVKKNYIMKDGLQKIEIY